MHLRSEEKLAIFLASVVGIGCLAVGYAIPQEWLANRDWLRYAIIIGGLLCIVVPIAYIVCEHFFRRKKGRPLAVAVLVAVCLASGLAAAFLHFLGPVPGDPEKTANSLPLKAAPFSLQSLFDSDFPNTSRFEIGLTVSVGEQKVEIKAKRYIQANTKSKFLGFYIPHSSVTADVCAHLADGYKKILAEMDSKIVVHLQVIGEQKQTRFEDLKFSGQIYIYHEDYLSPQMIGALTQLFEDKELDLRLRSQEYVVQRNLTSGL